MKKLFVILLSMIIVIGASAQKGGGVHYYRPRTHVIVGVGAGYYPYYPFYGPYSYWGYPVYYGRPSRLEIKVQDIKNDYKDRIWSVRHDDRLTKSQKRSEIHQLKSERENAIRDAERDYHNTY